MSTTPTLDPERTEQMRTFLVVEAASSSAAASPARRAPGGVRRSLAVGGVAASLVAGGLVVAAVADEPPPTRPADGRADAPTASPSSSAPVALPPLETIAVERSDGWTTVRLVDVDADPAAVVADLRAAGFAAEARDITVTEGTDGQPIYDGLAPDDPAAPQIAMASVVDGGAFSWGAEGLVGISVSGDDVWFAAAAPGEELRDLDVSAVPEGSQVASLSSEDGAVSVRDGDAVELVVYRAV